MNKTILRSRRKFLKLTAAAGLAPWTSNYASKLDIPGEVLPALPRRAIGRPLPNKVVFPESPPKPTRKDSLGVAIVGLGYYAMGIMMPRFKESERCHISALVSGNPAKLKRAGDAYGIPDDARYSYDDFDKIISDDRVEAVYIVLPSGLHADWTEKAFAAGKHVLCEKPMALSPNECERMISASKKANKKLMIAYRCHFEPHNLYAMKLMKEKAIGDIRVMRTGQEYRMGPENNPANNWRVNRALAGGGPLEDFGLYGLQASMYLTGENPEFVSAQTFSPSNDPRFSEIFAHVGIQLQFPSGAIAQLSTSYDSAGANRIYVRGQTGKLHFDNAVGYKGHEMHLEKDGKRQKVLPGDESIQFWRQLDHFASAIRENTKIITPGEMGFRDVKLVTAIYTSAAEGRTLRLHPDGSIKA